jgi:5'-phosphate synthase pdxT subunit
MSPRAGVVAIQGDYGKHAEALLRARPQLEVVEVRTPEDLSEVDRVILPGGESTTVGLLMERYGLGEALRSSAASGMPIWGTCMGMIMLAKQVVGRNQYTLGLLDIEVERNAFGTQIHSFEDEIALSVLQEPLTAVFIRAPVVVRLGATVEELGRYRERVVAVRQGNIIGTAFHPELTEDTRLHDWFLTL